MAKHWTIVQSGCRYHYIYTVFLAKRKRATPTNLKIHKLCDGPSKLCMSMNITKETCNELDMTTSDDMWIEDDQWDNSFDVVKTSRIGIDSVGGEWAKKPLRFYIMGNSSVSKIDKAAESSLSSTWILHFCQLFCKDHGRTYNMVLFIIIRYLELYVIIWYVMYLPLDDMIQIY